MLPFMVIWVIVALFLLLVMKQFFGNVEKDFVVTLKVVIFGKNYDSYLFQLAT